MAAVSVKRSIAFDTAFFPLGELTREKNPILLATLLFNYILHFCVKVLVIKLPTILYLMLPMSPQLVRAMKLGRWIRHVTELAANVTVKQKSLEGTVLCAR